MEPTGLRNKSAHVDDCSSVTAELVLVLVQFCSASELLLEDRLVQHHPVSSDEFTG